jgi:uncharacterized lipoprotein YddW (UPF0748 family)
MMKYRRILITVSILVLFYLATGFDCERGTLKKQEARGVWISRWEYTINLPSNTPENQRQKILEMMRQAKAAKLNFVLFQVRGQADAFYRSRLEPWAAELTGTLGRDPGWDPLQFAIDAAHAQGLQIHAWFNTFTLWKGKQPPARTLPPHLFHQHPEWLCVDGNGKRMPLGDHYLYLSPGIPSVQEYLQEVALELVKNYALDGIHFDYIRYPENSDKLGYSHDAVSVARFRSAAGNPRDLAWDDWQREQLNQFVQNFYEAARQINPKMKVSAAVLGSFDDSPNSSFFSVFQNSRQWLKEGWIDFLLPMIYWERNHPTAPFEKLTQEWVRSNQTERLILPGLAAYKMDNPGWPRDEIGQQVNFVRKIGADGMAFFSYSAMEKIWASGQYQFSTFANFPAMTWKDGMLPNVPSDVRSEMTPQNKVKISWTPPAPAFDGDTARSYNVYRTDSAFLDINDPTRIIGVIPAGSSFFVDPTVEPGKSYHYTVSALDACDNESMVSSIISVTVPVIVAKK